MSIGIEAPVAAGLATGVGFVILLAVTANHDGTSNAIEAPFLVLNEGDGIGNTVGPENDLNQGSRVVRISTNNISEVDVARGAEDCMLKESLYM